MRLDKELDEAFEEGKAEARKERGIRSGFTLRSKYALWAHQAGYDAGVAELRELAAALKRVAPERT